MDGLTRLVTTPLDKLMVFMPPGSAKSTYGSQLFPAWYLSQFPHNSVLAASHSEDLAERFGRRTRNLIENHAQELGITTDLHNRSAGRWQLATRRDHDEDTPQVMGEYMAAGVGSALTGLVDPSVLENVNPPISSLASQNAGASPAAVGAGGIAAGDITIVTPYANPRLVAIEALDALAAQGK